MEYSTKLKDLGIKDADFEQRVASMRAQQSERAGVSMRYLLSDDFMDLAIDRSGKGQQNSMRVCYGRNRGVYV